MPKAHVPAPLSWY